MRGKEILAELSLTDLTPAEKITFLLRSEGPLTTLEKICQDIPWFFPGDKAEELWRKNDKLSLLYYSLPTLKKVLGKFSRFTLDQTLDQKELFEEGFSFFQQHVCEWEPGKELSQGKPAYLRWYTFNRTNQDLERLVAERYGLTRTLRNYELVCLFERKWGEFCLQEERLPSLKEMIGLVIEANAERAKKGRKRLELGEGNRKVLQMYIARMMLRLEEITEEVAFPLDETCWQNLLGEQLKEALATLPSRQEMVLRLRYFEGETLQEVADRLDRSRATVSKIENQGLRLLRHPKTRRLLTCLFR